MQLTLFVPELLWPEPDDLSAFDEPACPALGMLIARSRLMRHVPQPFEAALSEIFVRSADAHDVPYAALRWLGETSINTALPAIPTDACWLCADPVHLRFRQEGMILADGGSLDIALAEARAIVADLNRNFTDLGMFYAASAERWYLQLTGIDAFAAPVGEFKVPPLSAVAGRRIHRQLPENKQTVGLRKLLNEAQMLLHAHPVNAARETAGQPSINSLWLWGVGVLPTSMRSDFDGVWSDWALAAGLARAAGVPVHPALADTTSFFAHAAPDGNYLITVEDLLAPVQYQDVVGYRAALSTLETRWFAPLRQALRSGKLERLQLVSPTSYGVLHWTSSRVEPWRWWRRARSLGDFAQSIAKEKI